MSTILALVDLILLVFLITLVARAVLDWTSALGSRERGGGVAKAQEITHRITEPVIAPVRQLLPSVGAGGVRIDLAFTVVFLLTVVLRALI